MLNAFVPIGVAMSILGFMIGWFGFRRPPLAYLWCVVVSAAALFGVLVVAYVSADILAPRLLLQLLIYWATPYALFFLLPTFGMASVVVGVRRTIAERRRQLVAMGCCLACGYDLRATPERCPECGEEVISV